MSGEMPKWITATLSLKIPPVGYQEACLCACCAGAPQGSGPEGRLEAVCTTLANYAQYCAKQHTHLLEEAWLLR